MRPAPTDDPTLRNLKTIALRGGERGPLYDQGVLEVVEQIERDGFFTKHPVAGILSAMNLQQQVNCRIATAEEEAEGQRFLAQKGWTLEAGLQYASGVDFAEGMLSRFRRPEGEPS